MKLVKNPAVRVGEYDASAKLSVMGVFQIAQDGVTDLLGRYGIDGVSLKRDHNALWVFAKNGIRMLKPLAWGEAFTSETFVSGYSLARVYVDVAVKNADGELVAYARVELCALDADSGRIRKTSTVGIDQRIECEPAMLDVRFETPNSDGLRLLESVRVRSSNIDMNKHTNNVEYIRFVLNTYTVAQLAARPIRAFDAYYANQSYEGDTLDVCKRCDADGDEVAILKDGAPVFKCKIAF